MEFGPNLPDKGMKESILFYFNIKGSKDKKDVKLVAYLNGHFAYLTNNDNDNNNNNEKNQKQWIYITNILGSSDIATHTFGMDFLVCWAVFLCPFFCFIKN